MPNLKIPYLVPHSLKSIPRLIIRRFRLTSILPGLLILLVSACNFPTTPKVTQPPGTSIAPTGIPSPTAPPTQPPTTPSKLKRPSVLPDDPRAAVEYALRAQPKALPFRVSTSIDSGANELNTIVEIESPQRILMVEPDRKVILVDGKCFEQTGSDPYEACTDAATGNTAQAAASNILDESVIDAGISMIQTVKFIGPETLDKTYVRVYEYTTSGDQLGIQVEGTTRLWVDEAKGLPLKALTKSTAGGHTATSTQLFMYDPAIKIEAP